MSRLDNFLAETSDSEFNQLFHRIDIARLLRDLERKYKKSTFEMAKMLNLSLDMYSRWRRGAVDFSVKNMASIEVLNAELLTTEAELFKTPIDLKKEDK